MNPIAIQSTITHKQCGKCKLTKAVYQFYHKTAKLENLTMNHLNINCRSCQRVRPVSGPARVLYLSDSDDEEDDFSSSEDAEEQEYPEDDAEYSEEESEESEDFENSENSENSEDSEDSESESSEDEEELPGTSPAYFNNLFYQAMLMMPFTPPTSQSPPPMPSAPSKRRRLF